MKILVIPSASLNFGTSLSSGSYLYFNVSNNCFKAVYSKNEKESNLILRGKVLNIKNKFIHDFSHCHQGRIIELRTHFFS